jgi:hypothetical protein
MAMKSLDLEFEDEEITAVHRGEEGWTITRASGWEFYVPRKYGVEPLPGMTARFYGKGIGYPVRGLDLDGQEVFYLSPEQQEEKHRRECERMDRRRKNDFETGRAGLDAQYEALPAVFQRRIDRFRRNNPDFRWEFEPYEMSCCVDAVKIAGVARESGVDLDQWFSNFNKADWKKQNAIVPGLFEGHSGNSFGCAVYLAKLYLTEPEHVVKMHGALAPLVGSEKYGCVPRAE